MTMLVLFTHLSILFLLKGKAVWKHINNGMLASVENTYSRKGKGRLLGQLGTATSHTDCANLATSLKTSQRIWKKLLSPHSSEVPPQAPKVLPGTIQGTSYDLQTVEVLHAYLHKFLTLWACEIPSFFLECPIKMLHMRSKFTQLKHTSTWLIESSLRVSSNRPPRMQSLYMVRHES